MDVDEPRRLVSNRRSAALDEIRPCVFRAAVKLQSLQRLCQMDVVSVQHVTAALHSETGAQQQEVGMNREEVMWSLNRMFDGVGRACEAAVQETCSLMLQLYDGSGTERVCAAALQTALIALCADDLLTKYKALVRVLEKQPGSISRSGLRSLLQDLSQVPVAVQEEEVFGGVEAAVKSCFNGVSTHTVSTEHVLSWLHSNPRLLLWLPTLYLLSVSHNVTHAVRCHTCKTSPITGLRFRCMKCVNVHVCQSCFLNQRQTRKHKTHHPVLEFCTRPSWKESLSSLMHSARCVLLPRRYPQREADRRVLTWTEPGETPNSGVPPPSVAEPFVHHSHVHPPPSSSIALQTDEETPPQQMKSEALLTEVRNLHRDKWLLEQELQAWRLTVQSEHCILEDRCSEVEVSVETLKQALNKMEVKQHANDSGTDDMETGKASLPSDMSRNTEEEDDDVEEEEKQTPSLTSPTDTPQSHLRCEEEEVEDEDEVFTGDSLLHLVREDGSKGAGLQQEDACVCEEEDSGVCDAEKLLQETVNRLQIGMETDGWRERQSGERKRVELLEAAGQVGDSIHGLVDGVRANTV